MWRVVDDNDERRWKPTDVHRERITSTKTDNLESMPPGSQPLLTQEALVRELPTSIPDVVHHARTQGLEVLGDFLEGENSRSDELEQAKEKLKRLSRDVIAYKMGNENLEKTLLQNEVETKAMPWFVVDFENIVRHLETEKCLLKNANKKFLSRSSNTDTRGRRAIDELLKYFRLSTYLLRLFLKTQF